MPAPTLPPGVSDLAWLAPPRAAADVPRNVTVGTTPRPVADQSSAAAPTPPAKTPAAVTPQSAPAVAPAPGTPDSTYLASVNGSNVGVEMSDLAEFGLQGPDAQNAIDWYNKETNALVPPAQMQIDMYQQPWFQKAFPGITQQIKNGQTPMSVQDYVTFKQGVRSFAQQFGLPSGFVTDADIGNMIGKGMTFDDFTQRVGLAFQASAGAASKNPEAVALLDKWYGIKPGSGALAAFYLDPTRAVSTLANATTGAQIGASAEEAGFIKLDQQTLLSLAAHGVSAAQGASAVSALTPLLPTTRGTVGPGHMPTDTETDLLASQLGGVPGETQEKAIERVQVAAGGRVAALRGGGNAGQGQPGQQTGAGFGTQ